MQGSDVIRQLYEPNFQSPSLQLQFYYGPLNCIDLVKSVVTDRGEGVPFEETVEKSVSVVNSLKDRHPEIQFQPYVVGNEYNGLGISIIGENAHAVISGSIDYLKEIGKTPYKIVGEKKSAQIIANSLGFIIKKGKINQLTGYKVVGPRDENLIPTGIGALEALALGTQ